MTKEKYREPLLLEVIDRILKDKNREQRQKILQEIAFAEHPEVAWDEHPENPKFEGGSDAE